MVSFHDNNHYNSVRDSKAPPPKPMPRKNLKTKISRSSSIDSQLQETGDENERTSSDGTSSTTATSSISELSVEDKHDLPVEEAREPDAKPNKKDPCPCGSGQKYKKCCLAKEKHAARLQKLKQSSGELSDEAPEQEGETKGNFRVVRY